MSGFQPDGVSSNLTILTITLQKHMSNYYKTEKAEEGDIILIEKGMKVYASIPKHFIYTNCIGDFTLATTDVTVGSEHNGISTDYLIGSYIVTRAIMTGGSHGGHDDYPDGWQLTCEKVKSEKSSTPIVITFYQSGCFTAQNEEVTVTGKAVQTWTVKK